MFGFDPLYFAFLIPGMILAGWASWRVKRTFQKYHDFKIGRGMSGAEVARAMLDSYNRTDIAVREHGTPEFNPSTVKVQMHDGFLSDHYDPSSRVVNLSHDVYHGRGASSVAVAAHECGHVLQDVEDYKPMGFRQKLVPVVNIGSNASWIMMTVGFMMRSANLVGLAVLLFSTAVLFQLVTLPVEFNASSRARKFLLASGLVTRDEDVAVGKVLNAAALTYVAAFLSSLLQLAYFLIRFSGMRRDED